jgi:hypothetical protein
MMLCHHVSVRSSFTYLVHTAQPLPLARSEAEKPARQTLSHRHYTCICRVKATSITYSECLSVALVIQHAKRMRLILLLSVAYLTLPHFDTVSH